MFVFKFLFFVYALCMYVCIMTTVPMELCHKELNADFFGSKEDDDWDDDGMYACD